MRRSINFEEVLDSISDCVFSISIGKPWQLYYINKAAQNIFEKDEEYFYQHPNFWHHYIVDEDKPNVAKAEEMLNSQGVFEAEYRIKLESGKIKWILDKSKLVYDENSQPVRIDGTISDITERKEFESKNIALLSASPDLFFIFNNNKEFIDYFVADKSLLLIEPEHFIGKKINEVMPDEIAGLFSNIIDETFNSGNLIIENYSLSFDGYIKYFEARVGRYGKENAIALIRDVTDEKTSKEKLESLNNLHQVINQISSELIQSTADNVDAVINQALELLGKYTGVDRTYNFIFNFETDTCDNSHEWCNEGINPEIDNLQGIPNSLIPRWFEKFNNNEYVYIPLVMEIAPEYHAEKEILEPQGIQSLLTVPMFYGKKLIGFAGFDSVKNQREWDIESINLLRLAADMMAGSIVRRDYEMEIIKQKQIADIANRAKSEFLANMSHEIRTPMNAILGFSEIMLNTINDPQNKSYLNTIINSGRTLLSLINDILDLSKIESGMLELQMEPVELRSAVKDVSLIFSNKVDEKKLAFHIEIDNNFPQFIQFDEVRLRQILINLIGNAVKFTHIGFVKVKVEITEFHDDEIDFSLSIQDSGIGIADEEKSSIFESFRQSLSVSARHYGGTGLGLTITKRLTEMLNGTIHLESELDNGSTFTINFKNVKIRELTVDDSNIFDWNNTIVKFNNAKLLVVDDVQQNIDVVKVFLENSELQFIETHTGDDAVEVSAIYIPDLILMDLRMPGISGFEAARRIKSNPYTAHIPIVAFTASNLESETTKIRAEFDGFLKKPVSRNQLISELVKHLPFTSESFREPQTYTQSDIETLFSEYDIENISILYQNLLIIDSAYSTIINNKLDFSDIAEIEKFVDDFSTSCRNLNLSILSVCVDKLNFYVSNFDYDNLSKTINQLPFRINNYLSEIDKLRIK